ncbi:MAG: HDOD domain-containing protein [Nitrospiraceae bacterium]|nr:MAG: HDOD domain-containing protein [Nitrospiraceae bacterium]
MTESLKQYVQKITQLPTIPVVAQEVLKFVHDEKTSVVKLENIIENDPALSAKILSVSNSAFFGYKTPTQTVHSAILRIGFNTVRDIAFGVSLMTVFEDKDRPGALDYQRVFNHSVTVGLIAQMISRDLKMGFSEEIFVNGILHDLGYLVLNKYFSETYMKVLEIFHKQVSLLEAEKTVMDFTHAEIGSWLAEKWNLPDDVIYTVRYHHTPLLATKKTKRVAIIHIADHMVSKGVFSAIQSDPHYPLERASLDLLGINEDYLRGLQDKVNQGQII